MTFGAEASPLHHVEYIRLVFVLHRQVVTRAWSRAMKRDVVWVLESTPDFEEADRIEAVAARRVRIGEGPLGLDALGPRPEGPVVAFGSIRRMLALARDPDWSDAVVDHHAVLACRTYYPALAEYFRRPLILSPLCLLEPSRLERWFGERVFIRPDSNTKTFDGQVVEVADWGEFTRQHARFAQDLVVVTGELAIEREWRVFCARGRAFAHSSYPTLPYTSAPREVIEFARGVSGALFARLGVRLASVDVARLEGGELVLIEVGGVCSWGLYGADVEDFVRGIEEEVCAQWSELWD